ncbi:hypothetical protein BO71DRAFT_395382 [Aspergillus ellipticus CBS 707.79]|uniref:Uncharacterized protein n=1 Tax=Aspergillus ellipticus CBS 707.79 TaxID=1448320 RepID=A0A319E3H5_9EURO|nr:hypothetical protein BO71DRAFT_395382 [Aspergillus ellipticus CBS 707.79]
MWLANITAQKAFAVAALFLTSGVSAAAIPSGLLDPASVSVAPAFATDVATSTQIATTGADGKPTPVPVADIPECRDCRDEDEDDQTTPSSLESVPVITVSSDDNSSDAPSKTTREPATEAKRAATATKSESKYAKLEKTLGKTPEVGQGYAIKIRSERNEASGVKYVDHYLIVVGYVSQTTEGNTVYLKFDSACYDIEVKDNKIEFKDKSDKTWYDFDGKFEVLGKIKSGLTHVEIEDYGNSIATAMDKKGYNLLTNNCRDFVMKLYKKIKA